MNLLRIWVVFLSSFRHSDGMFTKGGWSCAKSVDEMAGSEIIWPETPVNTTIYKPCNQFATGNISRHCKVVHDGKPGGLWADPDVTQCWNTFMSEFFQDAANLMTKEGTKSHDVVGMLDSLASLLEEAVANGSLYPADLAQTSSILGTVSGRVLNYRGLGVSITPLAQNYGRTVSTMLSAKSLDVWEAFTDKQMVVNISKDILNSMEHLAGSLLDIVQDGSTYSQDNVTVVEENLDFEVMFVEPTDGQSQSTILRGANDSSVIILPPELANISASMSQYGGRFGYYRAQFTTLPELLKANRISSSQNNSMNKTLILGSDLMSATVVGLSDSLYDLSSPFTIIFKHEKHVPKSTGINNVQCVFLDMSKSETSWSPDGCTVVYTDSEETICQCNHFTNFALIMDIFELEISEAHQLALSFISYIGGTLSIIGCLLSICIYEFFRLGSERVRVHEMLAVSIIFTQLIFFIGFERTENTYVCKAFAFLLHFFLTAMFCWMLVEGIHLYISLIKVFRRHSNLKKYCVIGWGVPVVIVLISGIVFFGEYGGADACWVTTRVLLIAFIPFVAVTIVINLGVLILVIRVMNKSMKKLGKNEDIPAAKSGIKAVITLTPLLGLTWVFGFLSVADHSTLVFTYLFTISNSLQGVMFFVFHCLRNVDVRSAFDRRYRRSSQGSSSNQIKHVPGGQQVTAKEHKKIERYQTERKQSNDDIPNSTDLPRKRVSAFSIDSADTNMTAVEDNININDANEDIGNCSDFDDLSWPEENIREGKLVTAVSTTGGSGLVKEHTVNKMDREVKEALEAFDAVFMSPKVENGDLSCITHM